jgi:Ca-activated chloride channel family protein
MSDDLLVFANGRWWPLLVVIVVVSTGAFAWLSIWRASVRRRMGESRLVDNLTASVSTTRRVVRRVLWVVGILLVGVALLRPQLGMEQAEFSTRGIDVVIALDLSNSMLADDLDAGGGATRRRLDGAVSELQDLLDRLQGGRVALVPFAGIAYAQSPLTSDFDAIRSFLRTLKPSDIPVQGTAIGGALDVSLNLLVAERREEDPTKTGEETVLPFASSKYKAILLVTDGEDHEERALDMAAEARGKGIRIYAMGVGSTEGASVPRVDGDGRETGERLMDPDSGNLVRTSLNEALLRGIANETHGAYFRYQGPSVAGEIYRQIEGLEKQEYAKEREERRQDRYAFLLVPAFVLLLAELFWSERRRRRP